MPEYAEQQTAGIEYTRCYQVIVDNRYGAVPQAIFHEQRVHSTPVVCFSAYSGTVRPP